jgi:hypothetical protein
MKAHTVSIQAQNHTFIVSNGTLSIDDEDKLLSPDETERLLEVLLIWRYGLEEISPDSIEE